MCEFISKEKKESRNFKESAVSAVEHYEYEVT